VQELEVVTMAGVRSWACRLEYCWLLCNQREYHSAAPSLQCLASRLALGAFTTKRILSTRIPHTSVA
jgi:hypothetical protein